jgi:glucosamine-6-phosphate deaminase
MASGKSKAQAVKQLLDGRVSEAFPASALHAHPDVTVLIDEEAAGGD